MRKMKTITSWLGFSFLALLLSCVGTKEGGSSGGAVGNEVDKSEGPVLAKVGEIQISLGEFEEAINGQNPMIRSRYNSIEQKQKLLDSLVEREAMYLEAKRLGLDQDPEVVRGYKKILARQLVSAEFNQKRAKEIEITDEEIEQYYKENDERYHSPEKVRVHHIFFAVPGSDKKKTREVQQKAISVLKQLKAKTQDRRLFIQLAREHSEDTATKQMGGDTNFKTHTQFVETYGKVFADTAFGLKQNGDLSSLVKTEKGFHILKQAGKQAAIDLPLEKVKNQIRTTLFAKARGEAYQQYIEEIKQKVGVKVFDDVLKQAKVDLAGAPPTGNQPPGIPRGPNAMVPQQGDQTFPHKGPPVPPSFKKLKISPEKRNILQQRATTQQSDDSSKPGVR